MEDTEIPAKDILNLLETNKRLIAAGEKKKMLDFVLSEAIRLSGAERGFVLFKKGGDYEAASAFNLDREGLKRAEEKFSRSVLRRVMETGEPLLVMDALEDPSLKQAESVLKMKLRSILCVPIRTDEGPLGALYLDHRFTEGAFQETQVKLVALFADQAALALGAIDSLEASRRHAEEMERLQRQLALLNEALEEKIERTERERDCMEERLGASPSQKGFEGLVGNSKALREVIRTIRRLETSDVTVHLYGESGTGKEVVARALHRHSARKEKPFVALNCAAFSETLLDSELFGHVRGAFTGADRDRGGLFVEASGGTIFLDEIGEMPFGMQAKLLRVLQEKELRPVGSSTVRKVDVRIVSATNQDLRQRVHEGKFREDLYYRLVVVKIDLPPLRERREDIPDLVRHFMQTNSWGVPSEFLSIDPEALGLLTVYDWPGNIRELQNEIHRCLVFGKGRITAQLLSPTLREQGLSLVPESEESLEISLRRLEKQRIILALEEFGGNKLKAAERLGVSRVKLYQRMKAHGLRLKHGQADAARIRKTVREAKGNRTLAARRLGISRKTLYNRMGGNS